MDYGNTVRGDEWGDEVIIVERTPTLTKFKYIDKRWVISMGTHAFDQAYPYYYSDDGVKRHPRDSI